MFTASVHIPSDFMSKRLKITRYACGKRKIQISSNWLPLYLFEQGTPVVENVLAENEGYEVVLAEDAPCKKHQKRIYQRTYAKRTNQPFECLFETTAKRILDVSIPKACDFVHVVFTAGRLVVKPWFNALASRIDAFCKNEEPFSIFAACTSGIDSFCAVQQGFVVNSILERRPQSKRDKVDLTETGVLTAIGNIQTKHVFNEDINHVDASFVAESVAQAPSSLFTISLECSEFSCVKSSKYKAQALDDLSSSLDMIFDGIRLIDALQPPMILLEQTIGFNANPLGSAWNLRLRRMGYQVYEMTMKASEYGGITHRPRYFSFATSLPYEFVPPVPTPISEEPLWSWLVEPFMHKMRDVTHSKSLQDGLKCGRLRIITPQSTVAPTLLRSQRQQCKDSVVVQTEDGRLLWPTLEQERMLMTLPDSFSLDNVAESTASQILGQAVDCMTYTKILQSIRQHISGFLNSIVPSNTQLALI